MLQEYLWDVTFPSRPEPKVPGTYDYTFTVIAKNTWDGSVINAEVNLSEIAADEKLPDGTKLNLLRTNLTVARITADIITRSETTPTRFDMRRSLEVLSGNSGTPSQTLFEISDYILRRTQLYADLPITVLEILSAIRRGADHLLMSLRSMVKDGIVASTKMPERFFKLEQLKKDEELFFYLNSFIQLKPSQRQRLETYVDVTRAVQPSVDGTSAFDFTHYKIIEIDADRLKDGFVFYMTPFDKKHLELFETVIRPHFRDEVKEEIVISKDDHGSISLNNSIISHIAKCRFGVANISTQNPNVLYELGFAHAINKNVIIICDEHARTDKSIFDIQNINTVFYSDNAQLKEQLSLKARTIKQKLDRDRDQRS